MNYLTHSNRGTIIEELMSNTASYYRANKIAYFRKTNPAYTHISKKNKQYSEGLLPGTGGNFQIKLTEKGDLDYYGIYRGKYFAIELKETKKEIFSLSQIKAHQLSQLTEIHELGGIALVLVHFMYESSSFWIITYSQLQQLRRMKRAKKFSSNELENIQAYRLSITHPYILNLQVVLDQILKDILN